MTLNKLDGEYTSPVNEIFNIDLNDALEQNMFSFNDILSTLDLEQTKIILDEIENDMIDDIIGSGARGLYIGSGNGPQKTCTYDNNLLVIVRKCINDDFLRGKYSIVYSKGVRKGKLLADKLQIRNEEKYTKYSRLEHGRIDRRLLYSLGIPGDKHEIFTSMKKFTNLPVYIHITIDASGSMGDGSKFTNALEFAIIMASLSLYTKNVEVEISFRYSDGFNHAEATNVIAFDSKTSTFKDVFNMTRLQVKGTTPESLCYEAIMDTIISRSKNKESFFITLTDGEPDSINSIKHCQKIIKSFVDNNIQPMAFFVSHENNPTNNFVDSYGKYGNNIDVTDITKIATKLNKLLSINAANK